MEIINTIKDFLFKNAKCNVCKKKFKKTYFLKVHTPKLIYYVCPEGSSCCVEQAKKEREAIQELIKNDPNKPMFIL